jgi:hypothetical protein
MRHKKEVHITESGRDEGKTFILTEMPAEQGEGWALRAMELLEKSGFIVTGQKENGMAGLAITARPFTLETARALQDPSLDAMWQYVQFQPKGDGPKLPPPQRLFSGDDCQIQEWTTRLKLRVAFVELHTGFFSREKAQTSGQPSAPSSS